MVNNTQINTASPQETKVNHLTLNVILAIAIIACSLAVLFLYIESKSEPQQITYDPIPYRLSMSDDANELADRSAPGSEFITKMQADIDGAPSDEVHRSLDIFLIYLSDRHGFHEDAALKYDEYMEDPDILSVSEVCELSEYIHLISSYQVLSEYDEQENSSTRTTSCTEAMSLPENQKKNSESDLEYAIRIYYNGFITNGVDLLLATEDKTLTDAELDQKYRLLLDYYQMANMLKEYYDIAGQGFTFQETELENINETN